MLALVTGASGFVGSHVVSALIEAGFTVRACARSFAKVADWRLCNPDLRAVQWHVVPDLAVVGALSCDTMRDVTTVMHVAAPAVLHITDGRAAVDSIIDSTLEVLRAAKACPTVERVILTSTTGTLDDRTPSADIVDNWRPTGPQPDLSDALTAYCIGKTLAERAAWDFMKTHKPGFTLTTILPSYIIGPRPFQPIKTQEPLFDSTAGRLARLALNIPGSAFDSHWVVDVRDVALAHFRAALSSEAAGHRLLMDGHGIGYAKLARVAQELFPQLHIQPEPMEPSVEPVHVGSDIAKRILGLEPRPIEISIRDTIDDALVHARRLNLLPMSDPSPL